MYRDELTGKFRLEDSALWRHLLSLEAEAGPGGLIDLTRLWHFAGRPKGRSPRQKYPKDCKGYKDFGRILKSVGRTADSPAWATSDTARSYVESLDPRIMIARQNIIIEMMDRDPVGWLMDAPEGAKGIAAVFIKPIVANQAGLPREEADRLIIAEAIERTSGLDVFEQETKVAEVQRAVRGERPLPAGSDDE
ncbi:MAG: hypothetical protein JO116_24510 [Planctomycetaceae bacterium]|nr:hypothetical protein [Planctomycetaceae bacterium]MBV8558720.1 hypothetical protein [Planctomycetaceae bacterium]